MGSKKLKTFKIVTFGCRVNQAESRLIGEQLSKDIKILDIEKLRDKNKKPDLVVINSCCVTNKAEREVRKEIRRAKRENPRCFLVVCGCWANRIKNSELGIQNDKLETKIDLLINNKEKEKIADILKKQFNNITIQQYNNKVIYKDKYAGSKKALIKVQEGCNNFCSYCVVPYVRGRSQSRDAEEIIQEINKLVKNGIEQITLTGTDISAFKFKTKNAKFKKAVRNLKLNRFKNNLAKLIRLILLKTKIKKINFGSINMQSFDNEFLNLFPDSRITNHFHIPLQSGSGTVLKRMNRKYTVKEFIKTIKRINHTIPHFTFSTDLIVGFPGETKKEFMETLKTIKAIKKNLGGRFIKIHTFRYSARSGTAAYKMAGETGWERIAEIEKKKRSKIIRNYLK